MSEEVKRYYRLDKIIDKMNRTMDEQELDKLRKEMVKIIVENIKEDD